MTDDEILQAASKIKARRLNQKRLASFQSKDSVSIRWDNAGATFGEAYTGIKVPASAVADAVAAYFSDIT